MLRLPEALPHACWATSFSGFEALVVRNPAIDKSLGQSRRTEET